jgi:hypothetical protein
MAALERFVTLLAALVPACDVWVDGSFVTAKDEPDDIDLSVMVDGEVFDRLDPVAQQSLLDLTTQPLKPELHTFVSILRPRDHPDHRLTEDYRNYLAELWCVTRVAWLKGLPVIKLGETEIGLRLLP